MKNYALFLWIALLMLGISGTIGAREVASFNDGWEFKKGPFSKEALQAVQKWNSDWQEVSIPHTWNADDMQKQASAFYEGVGYYRKKFTFPENMEGKRIFLRFEGVGSYAEVYINGYLAGTHKGAYSAFACEISSQVKFGKENEIIVKADNSSRPDVIPTNHILFGVYGGIYRPVWLVVTETCSIIANDCASPGVYIIPEKCFKEVSRSDCKSKGGQCNLSSRPTGTRECNIRQERQIGKET